MASTFYNSCPNPLNYTIIEDRMLPSRDFVQKNNLKIHNVYIIKDIESHYLIYKIQCMAYSIGLNHYQQNNFLPTQSRLFYITLL